MRFWTSRPSAFNANGIHVATIDTRSTTETRAAMLQVRDGENHLRTSSEPTLPRADAAAFAPDAVDGAKA